MVELVIRSAKREDRAQVLKFTQNTFSWGDYVGRRFNTWFGDKSGRLITAERNGVVVGIVFVRQTSEREAWIQGLRVHPGHRRKRIASAMMTECVKTAMKMGAKTIRLATYETNLPAQALFANLGFTLLSKFSLMRRKVARMKDIELLNNVKVADKESATEIWRHIKGSPIYSQCGGLFTILFVWFSLNEQELRKFISKKRVLVYAENDKIRGVMIVDNSMRRIWNRKGLQSCYMDYDDAEIAVKLAKSFLNLASSKHLESVDLWTCFDEGVLASLEKIGFKVDKDEPSELVYFKELAP
ncbi:MAG: GNAT family N-acetyltransferase [Candidatus Atabeyarchaeum deiterrae]